jgi:peroxiredoxin
MKRLATAALLISVLAAPAQAALKPGDQAPDFTAQAAVGGKDFTFSLADALKRGPVVLYFYPKSFTQGCTIEAHDFAEAADRFKAAGATLIGMSHDTIETQRKFSTEECRDKFPVAADPNSSVIKAYDAAWMIGGINVPGGISERVSYVIAPDGKIIYAYSNSSPDKHIENTLSAVQHWRDQHKN